jgi:hypothetical protein
MMKNLVYTFFVIIGFSMMSFAQESDEIAVSQGKQELVNSKMDGVYEFTFASQTAEEIKKSASYYTNYFTVVYDESSKVATITMIENDPKGRAVIMRFLSASGARYIDVDGTMISTSEFMVEHL